MAGVLGWVVGGALAVWFVATAVSNVPRFRLAVTRHDVAQLLPNWALFANPRMVDMVLLRRDILADGVLTDWEEVDVARPPRWYNCVWNPGLGPKRALLALSDQLDRASKPYRQAMWEKQGQGTAGAIPIMLSVPYLVLLKYVSRNSEPSVDAAQFMVMALRDRAIRGRFDPNPVGEVVVVSEFHLVRNAVEPSKDRVSSGQLHRHIAV